MPAPVRPFIANNAARRGIEDLINRYGLRTVLEAVSDYCGGVVGLNVWAERFHLASEQAGEWETDTGDVEV